MLPTNTVDDITVETTLPSLTYKLDTTNKRIVGKISGREALEQTIYKILDIERYEYLIYNWLYGVEVQGSIGQDLEFIRSNIEKIIVEGLTQDDRIDSVENVVCTRTDVNSILVTFKVITTEGVIEMSKEYIND